MRITKSAEERRNEIIDVAYDLFTTQGYEQTGISEILKHVNIARGTFYYHFKSKEDILDAMIERKTTELIEKAKQVAEDRSLSVPQRLLGTLTAMQADDRDRPLMDEMHRPNNALLHQKSLNAVMDGIPPILTGIVIDGIAEGIFQTDFPLESVEMLVVYSSIVFDDVYANDSGAAKRAEAFITNAERIFGAQPGTFRFLLELGIGGKGTAGSISTDEVDNV